MINQQQKKTNANQKRDISEYGQALLQKKPSEERKLCLQAVFPENNSAEGFCRSAEGSVFLRESFI